MRLRIAAILALVIGWQLATMLAASQLEPSSLGPPIARILGSALYAPWKWASWTFAFGPNPPAVLIPAQAIGYGSVLLMVLLALLSKLGRSKVQASAAHGSARWATLRELRDVGLGETGVVICQTGDAAYDSKTVNNEVRWSLKREGELISDSSSSHVLCFAPTGSGKGAGLVIPTLLSWLHSVVAYDPKGELYTITAGWRRQFSHVIRFEPTSARSAQYNPLWCVPRGDGDVREAQNIAEILVPKDYRGKRDHWQLTAYKLLVGAILHVLYAGTKKDLRGVLELLTDPQRPIRDVLKMMMQTHHLGDRPHPQVVSAARAADNKSDNELSGVVSTAETCLDLWLDPIVAENTSRSDFCAEQLQGLDHPVSLYIVVPTRDIERLTPLVRLMVIQLGNRLTAEIDEPSTPRKLPLWRRLGNALLERKTAPAPSVRRKQRLLFLLDEFPTLGYLPWVESAIAYLRGYKIKLFLIAQSLNQLEKHYGPNHAFIDNSWARVTYTGYDDRTAKRISDLLGQCTEVQQRESHSKKRGSLWFDSVSTSTHEHGRPLMTAGEILTLPYTDAILFVGGVNGYRARKIMYYIDPRFAPRANLPRPDSPEEQAAELPRPLPASEWRELAPIAAAQPVPIAPSAAPLPRPQPRASVPVCDEVAGMEHLSALEESVEEGAEVMPW
jgi:type IV secretion system protein VirD4